MIPWIRFATIGVAEHFKPHPAYPLAHALGLLLLILFPEITRFPPRQAGAVR